MSARSLNKVMLIGNLTRDPEVRYTANGSAVATFGIATNRSWKNQDGEVQESTEFHNIVAWGKLAEICQQLLAKGRKVYIEGSLTTRNWEDEAGVTHYKTEIRVSDLIILDNKRTDGATGETSADSAEADGEPAKVEEVEENSSDGKAEKKDESAEDVLDDDLPF